MFLLAIIFNIGLFGGPAEHWDWWGTRIQSVEQGGFRYRFQHTKWNTVDYVMHKVPVKKPLHGTIILDCEIKVLAGVPNPVFRFDTDDINLQNRPGVNPANCRPILFTGNLNSDFGRWFPALDFIPLKPGRFTLAVPITPDKWFSVYGRRGTQDLAQWRQAMNNIDEAGVVFGGGFFVSHGDYVPLPSIVEYTCHSLVIVNN